MESFEISYVLFFYPFFRFEMISNSFVYELIGVLIALAVVVGTYFKTSYKYWQRKGVPFIEPRFPLGNNLNPFNQKIANYEMVRRFYKYFKSEGHPFGGIYFITVPTMVLVDPDMIRNIMAKDFLHFTNRGTFYDEKNDPLSAHLFNLEGQAWKNMRMKLTPTFTTGKMKMMFETLLTCGDQMIAYIDDLGATKEPLNIKSILMYFTTDVIGSCAFGIDCNSFKDKDSEFIKKGSQIFVNTLARKIRFLFILGFPNLCKKLKLRVFEKHLSDFYLNVVKDTVRYREERTIRRNDFMQILLEMKKSDANKEGLTIEQIAAQSFVFFIAGFETSSTTMNFCLYELARHQDIQEKLRNEIREVLAKHDGKLTYEGVMEMKYLGKVLDGKANFFFLIKYLYYTIHYQFVSISSTFSVFSLFLFLFVQFVLDSLKLSFFLNCETFVYLQANHVTSLRELNNII